MLRIVTVLCLAALAFAAPLDKRTITTGKATWFDTEVGQGACGNWNKNTEHIVAVNSAQYGGGQHCGQQVYIKNDNNGKTVTAKVADACPGCVPGGLDLTPSAFSAIANQDEGTVPISWWFE